ncbi:ABZJ_00895 family protein [Acinetobacter bohemicus]|uniref:ABZJ_00895 family protein n=1 Tax=Acinetobacter TaxID=469 RepID=UPI00209AB3BD|nr:MULTISPECIES: ABZJ_00895 family protein [Acinetobacter]MCO8042843.1 ABZJ_00895 family protein [Acinetobacter sp. S4400-12]MCO8045550.1 ABZJ_00895 family protein [Acinetobacter sp. S4397-1]MCU7225027.1 ABZJ_00895 family protein [Acinetobacter bohemicus]
MVPLTRYFLWFFFLCFVFTCICGVLAALMPTGMGAILTIVPYLVAMIWVLFKFLKQQRRAPSATERKKFSLGFSLIYWGYNLAFLILGIVIATRSNPNAWQDFLLYLQQPQFVSIVVIMFLLIAIPLYLLTYWFYGKQAQRMAAKTSGL